MKKYFALLLLFLGSTAYAAPKVYSCVNSQGTETIKVTYFQTAGWMQVDGVSFNDGVTESVEASVAISKFNSIPANLVTVHFLHPKYSGFLSFLKDGMITFSLSSEFSGKCTLVP